MKAFESVRLYGYESMRAALKAFLNPPQPEETPVSEPMLYAGNEAWNQVNLAGRAPHRAPMTDKVMSAIYRSMANLDPTRHKAGQPTDNKNTSEDVGRGPSGPEDQDPYTKALSEGWTRTRCQHGRKGDSFGTAHRRHTDPK